MPRVMARVVLALSIGIVAATPPTATAAVMLYSDRPTFLAHSGSVTTYGFEVAEGFPDAGTIHGVPSFAGGTITTAVPAGFAALFHFPNLSSNQVLGEQTLIVGPIASTPLTLTFGPNRGAIGFDIYFPVAGESGTVTVGFADNTSSMFNLVDNDANTATSIFWGVVSTVPIKQLTSSGTSGSLLGMMTMLDNVAVDAPEPSGLALAAFGALGTLAGRRRARDYGRA
jgi:PEP-CTERM motif